MSTTPEPVRNAPALVCRFRARPDQIRTVRQAVASYAIEQGADDPSGIAIAVSETVTNIVLHAYVDAVEIGDVEVRVQRLAGDWLSIVVSDDGRGMVPRPDSPGAGFGLALVQTLAETLEICDRLGGGSQVSMTFAAH